MASKRRKKRVRRSRFGKQATRKPGSVGGRALICFWVVTLVLVGTPVLLFRHQFTQRGHAEIPLALVVYLAGMVIIALYFTIRWFCARHNKAR